MNIEILRITWTEKTALRYSLCLEIANALTVENPIRSGRA
jgi:hypothetical protein